MAGAVFELNKTIEPAAPTSSPAGELVFFEISTHKNRIFSNHRFEELLNYNSSGFNLPGKIRSTYWN